MAGPSFGGAPVTSNKGFDPSKDHTTPSLRALSLGGMTGAGALAGTTGAEAQLVHGDVWYQIEGNETENILKNLKTTITLNETRTVLTNLINKVNGTTNDTRMGVHNQMNCSPRNDEFQRIRSEIHHQEEMREQKEADLEKAKARHELFDKHFEFNWFKLTVFYGPEIILSGIVTFEGRVLNIACKTINSDNTMIECELGEIKTAIGLVFNELLAVKAKVAVSHLKAIAANLNAGIAANGDSPFG